MKVIYVNGIENQVETAYITFEELVRLAFGEAALTDPSKWDVVVDSGQSGRPHTILKPGMSIKVKNKMVVTVSDPVQS